MKTTTRTAFIAVLFTLLAASAIAETRYIADQLVVTVRSSTGNNYQALDNLPTDTPVEVLSEDANFVKVKTTKGIEGYIRRQYVTKKLPKPIQIATLKKQKEALEQKLEQQSNELKNASALANSSQTATSELTTELEKTRKELESVTTEYNSLRERSQNIISVTTERDQLLEENSQLLGELKVLQDENANFHRSNMIQWFLAGGGVFFFGWLAGKVSRKKQRYSRF
ncbi:SH3 domain protein [Malonomonas rubra DSM 5091]|uniref:SH3 domain protein n=1 Tax=Malonomonas rubra DSM 5091 TaxID=1122189 RepID=A0A1M6DVP0_MALRU|nr:TIGR04211 family SH3 domain-containing protein [Malonomonas rubra]SHI77282.1 SH3 domain protein [Malonomonas rubra DSM 5091]